MDYLCHNSYTNTARVFSRDSAVRNVDADGDEIMTGTGGEEDDPVLSEDMLKQVGIRKGTPLSVCYYSQLDCSTRHTPQTAWWPCRRSGRDAEHTFPDRSMRFRTLRTAPALIFQQARIPRNNFGGSSSPIAEPPDPRLHRSMSHHSFTLYTAGY